MRLLLLATAALLLATPVLQATPARADYKMAEEKLQAGDVAGAMPLLAEEAKLGNPVAAFNLAKIYEDGSGGVQDFTQAATYYKIAAEIDTAPRYNGAALGPQGSELIAAAQKYGQFALGRLYETGQGVPRDPREAVFWYTRAADLGLQQAMLKLAVIYQEGLPGTDGDAGIAADAAKAVPWLEQAAGLGNVAAMNELGRAYLAGDGVLANARIAAEWFQKASDAGSLTADYSLGSIYRVGFAGQPDFIRAVRHFERAANGKESASMVALGDLYANGQGVPLDKVQALTWYKLAALYGQPEGGKRGEMLAAGMTPEEQAQAKRRAETWMPSGDAQQPVATAQPNAGGVPLHTGAEIVPPDGGMAPATAPGIATPTPGVATPAPAMPDIVAPDSNLAAPDMAAPPVAEPTPPAPLPASTPTALEWVAPVVEAPAVQAPAAQSPAVQAPAAQTQAPAVPAAPAAEPLLDNQPFDPFAQDPFNLQQLTPQLPGGAPTGAKPYIPPP
ncbi:TPR repeat protein [Dongia mobilis]|uniref:TPR repeat protein n=1 Tax=Dongia mobilis TaxID=578943 RepID=A0A4R6WMG8_9PROT|nr:tetratricopeptide repeat protein [Dongia mobilis]TDQ82199.1 TPR repeat protein [Dongia mobilis]